MIAIVSVPCTLKLLQGNDVHLSACVGCHLVIFIEKNGIDFFVFTDYKIADLIGKVRIRVILKSVSIMNLIKLEHFAMQSKTFE